MQMQFPGDLRGAQVGVVMGSASDWPTMQAACDTLQRFGIAGAGGAAHLPGMLAAKTTLPVLGVPVATRHLGGQDSLYSIVQMPKGVPVATFAIGEAGAANAAIHAARILALSDGTIAAELQRFAAEEHDRALAMELPCPAA
jgi:5-(carboxyamino)imidazole ribonucleotide mutase